MSDHVRLGDARVPSPAPPPPQGATAVRLVGSRADPSSPPAQVWAEVGAMEPRCTREPVQPLRSLKTGADFQKTLPVCQSAREELQQHLISFCSSILHPEIR